MTAEPLTAEECAAAQALCDKATPDPELIRYDHGGGRSLLDGGVERTLIADYYNEADREFYHAARSLLPRALATIAVFEQQVEMMSDLLARESERGKRRDATIAAVEAERYAWGTTIAELRKTLAEAHAIADALQDSAYINGAKHIYSFPPDLQRDALDAVVNARTGYLRPIKEKCDAERAERARASKTDAPR